MVALNEIKTYLKAGYSFYYTSCKDYGYFLSRIYKEIGKRSLFVWKRDKLECIYWYDPDYENETEASRSTNAGSINALPNKKISEVFQAINNRCSWYQKELVLASREKRKPTPASMYEDVQMYLPRGSIIIFDYMDTYLERFPDIVSFIVDGITTNIWGNYELAVVAYSPMPVSHPLFTSYGVELSIPVPTLGELTARFKNIFSNTPADPSTKSWMEREEDNVAKEVVPVLKGMYPCDGDRAVGLSLIRDCKNKDIRAMVSTIERAKTQATGRDRLLEYVNPEDQRDPKLMKGMNALLEYLEIKAYGFTEEARQKKLAVPRGIVLLGPPGTGKTDVATAVGRILKLPTFFLHVSAAFNQFVGVSESNMMQALQKVDEQDGCVLIVDEADKVLSGASGSTDSGTTARVCGLLLNWLSRHKSRTFVVFTMNSTDTVPPEALRTGRFNRTFYTDLPTPQIRKEIILSMFERVDISEKELRLTEKDWERLIADTDKFMGAELQEVVDYARDLANGNRQEPVPTIDELLSAAKHQYPPMAIAESERVQRNIDMCRKYGTPVYRAEPEDFKKNIKAFTF